MEPSDEALCRCAADGSREAEEALVRRYSGLVRSCARPLFLAGGDSEDLIQEGMFGLIRAIPDLCRGVHPQPPHFRASRGLARQAFTAQPVRSLGYPFL